MNASTRARLARIGFLIALAALVSCSKEKEGEATGEPATTENGAVGSGSSIAPGAQVSLEYTLKLDDGSLVETNVGKQPFVFTHGTGKMVPGLERQIEGMKVGETKEVTVAPDGAFGPVQPQAIQEVPKDKVPETARVVGSVIRGDGPRGSIRGRVVEVKDDVVMVDFNHPLAGKTLHFTVKVLGVEPPGAAPDRQPVEVMPSAPDPQQP